MVVYKLIDLVKVNSSITNKWYVSWLLLTVNLLWIFCTYTIVNNFF